MTTGTSRRASYTPGQPRERFSLIPEGTYPIVLADIGKAGLAGWRKGKTPQKFPNRMIRWTVVGTPDPKTGKDFTLVDFVSLSPKAEFRVADLAYAGSYPKALDCALPTSPSDKQGCAEWSAEIDALLEFLKDGEIVLYGVVKHEEYNGRTNARIAELKTQAEVEAESGAESEDEDEDEGADDEEVAEAPAEDADEEDAEDDEDEPEPEPVVTKAKAKAKAKAK